MSCQEGGAKHHLELYRLSPAGPIYRLFNIFSQTQFGVNLRSVRAWFLAPPGRLVLQDLKPTIMTCPWPNLARQKNNSWDIPVILLLNLLCLFE